MRMTIHMKWAFVWHWNSFSDPVIPNIASCSIIPLQATSILQAYYIWFMAVVYYKFIKLQDYGYINYINFKYIYIINNLCI